MQKELLKLKILAKISNQKSIIQKLQKLGVVHIVKSGDNRFSLTPKFKDLNLIAKLLIQLNYILENTKIKKEFLLEGLPPYSKVIDHSKKFVDGHFVKVKNLVDKNNKLKEDLEILKNNLDVISQIPFNLHPSTNQISRFVYYSFDECDLKAKFDFTYKRKKLADKYFYYIKVKNKDSIIFEKSLQKSNLKKINIDFIENSSLEDKELILLKLDENKNMIAKLESEIFKKINGKQSKINFLISSLENFHAQLSICSNFSNSKNLFVLEGYVEKDKLNLIKDSFEDLTIHASKAKKDAPTKIINNKYSNKFEPITKLYGVPKYNSYDPTLIISFFFPLFFGFMLSDVGYGLLLLISLIPVYLKFKEKAKDALIIFSISAFSSILFGLTFGSFFGNLIKITPLFKDSFEASFTILLISLIIGLVHLNLGVILKAYNNYINKVKFFDNVFDVIVFPLLQICAVLFYYKLNVVAFVVLGIAIAILLKEKSFFGLMDITGYFGTWFSYARLLALSLATAGVALAINIIASKAQAFGKVGMVLWLVILVVGHLFNFALNILGCTIHAARLHYVEFFSFFYESGGYEFNPFKILNKK
jgi:V/A-type H+-transporting ATPase subunit I